MSSCNRHKHWATLSNYDQSSTFFQVRHPRCDQHLEIVHNLSVKHKLYFIKYVFKRQLKYQDSYTFRL
jgi:hypothetical protein